MRRYFDFFNFDVFQNPYSELVEVLQALVFGIDFYGLYVVQTLPPTILAACFFTGGIINHSGRRIWFACALGTLYLTFPSVSAIAGKMFRCIEIEGFGSRLSSDTSIHCSGATYDFYFTYALFVTVVFPIGTPLLVAFLLYHNKEQIKRDEQARDADFLLRSKRIGYLYDSYKPDYWWFEAFEMYRRLILCFLPFVLDLSGTTMLPVIFIFMAGAFCVYLVCLPYGSRLNNFIGCFGALSPVAGLFMSLMARIQIDDDSDDFGGFLLVLATSMLAVYVLALLGILYYMFKFHHREGDDDRGGVLSVLRDAASNIKNSFGGGGDGICSDSDSGIGGLSDGEDEGKDETALDKGREQANPVHMVAADRSSIDDDTLL